MKTPILLGLWGLTIVLAAGCAKPPAEEMRAAQEAVEKAARQGAEEFAAPAFQSAREAMTKAVTYLEKKSYKAARLAAEEARTKGEAALTAAAEARKALREKTSAQLTAQKAQMEILLEKLSRAKSKAVNDLRAEAAALKGEVGAALGDLDNGHERAAEEKAEKLESRVKDLTEKCDEALRKKAPAAKPAPKKRR